MVEPLGQIAVEPVIETTGKEFTDMTVAADVLVPQPVPSSYVIVYEPAAFTTMLSVVAPVLQVLPPFWLDRRMVLSSWQKVVGLVAVMVGVTCADAITCTLSVVVQPFASVTVSLYPPAVLTFFVCVVSPPGVHK